MAFKFKRKESVLKAVKRLGQRRVEKALKDLRHCDRLEAVHEVRKRIKQLRALLRLTRAAIRRGDYRRCSKVLRTAAEQLAAARDAYLKVEALADLTAHFRRELTPASLCKLRTLLSADCRKEQTRLAQNRARRKVEDLFKQVQQGLASLKSKSSGWRALAPRLKASYRDGRRGFRLARKEPTPEHLHEWRKRAKDLLYQIGLLCPIWPEQMAAAESELKDLGQSLGDDHDLFLLAQASQTKSFRKQAEEEVETLGALVEARQKELRSHALALGARFYADKPSAFCRRIERFWRRWRWEPKQAMKAS